MWCTGGVSTHLLQVVNLETVNHTMRVPACVDLQVISFIKSKASANSCLADTSITEVVRA